LYADGTVTHYNWQPATGLTNANIANPIATVNATINYVVTGTADNGCIASDTVRISIRPDPVILIHSDKDNISCTDRSMRLFASGALSYLWSPGFYCNDSTSANPIVTPPGTTLFTVKGIDIFGCRGIDSIRVISSQDEIVFIPDAFTPNGDGLNDVIKPVVFCNFDFQQFCVFDRWGKNIFISYLLNHGWDGTYNGALQPMDVYYYFVKGQKNDGSTEIIKGSFTLIR
jgi:gliding motility-associated-like protein